MSNNNSLNSGLVQSNTGMNTTTTTTNTTSTIVKTTSITDCNIFPVGNTIDSSNTVYDGQTILMINSSINPNSNTATAQYFNPVSGLPSAFSGNGFSGWNYDICNTSYLNGVYALSSEYNNDLSIIDNIQGSNYNTPTLNSSGFHIIDVTNGTNTSPLFFSLAKNPYTNSSGTPQVANLTPSYSNNNSDNFLFTSNYFLPQKNEILIIELLFTVSNTDALNNNASNTRGTPSLSVIVTNKVISQEVLANLASSSNNNAKVKVYTSGSIPLQYMQNGNIFEQSTPTYSYNNNMSVVIAPGYQKVYATVPVIYIPGLQTTDAYYLKSTSYSIDSNGLIQIDVSTATGLGKISGVSSQFGYFVVGIAYSHNVGYYVPNTNIYGEISIRNIWRSPIAIYNSYSQYSVSDMATKQVVLLFGRSYNGGTFLVTNTGTPISSVSNYGVTSLRNFISIMRTIINNYDGSVSLVDYFINQDVISSINAISDYSISVVSPQSLLDGSITNPPTIVNNPNMWYFMLNSKNTANMIVDPTEQVVFGQNIGFNYLGLKNSVLASTGVCNYNNYNLNMLSDTRGDLFGNSLSLGLNLVGIHSYYVLLILPEVLFNPSLTLTNNIITIYSSLNTLFYIMISSNSASQFAPSSSGLIVSNSTKMTNNATTSKTNSNFTLQPVYSVNKIMLSVSNTKLL